MLNADSNHQWVVRLSFNVINDFFIIFCMLKFLQWAFTYSLGGKGYFYFGENNFA